MKKYKEWSLETNNRWIDAANCFGEHLFKQVRSQEISNLPDGLSDSEREIAIESIDKTIYAFMMMFDGVQKFDIDTGYSSEYALIQRVRNNDDEIVSEIELAPAGDGLCMEFHGWKENDFGE